MTGLLGKKIGMTHVFTEDGKFVSVTAIEAGPCPVLAVKEKRVQLGFGMIREASVKKPAAGYFKKLDISPCKFIREVSKDPAKEYNVGDQIKVDMFKTGDFVDISGISKGKGFQGGMKRWGWHGGPKTHGSTSHRRIGSLGSSTTPGRVWKGQHLPGHMGASLVTIQNLKVVKVETQNNLLLVAGAVPGLKNSYLVIRFAKKKKAESKEPLASVSTVKPADKAKAKK